MTHDDDTIPPSQYHMYSIHVMAFSSPLAGTAKAPTELIIASAHTSHRKLGSLAMSRVRSDGSEGKRIRYSTCIGMSGWLISPWSDVLRAGSSEPVFICFTGIWEVEGSGEWFGDFGNSYSINGALKIHC